MSVSSLKVPSDVREFIRRLHPELKRKVRAALSDILDDPTCGKALKEELEGYLSFSVGRSRMIYRIGDGFIEIVAVGLEATFMKRQLRQIRRDQKN